MCVARRAHWSWVARAPSLPGVTPNEQPWWQTAVFYQVYPLSFNDSNGDGFGDLPGIIERLDYLSDTLGVDAIWMSPFYCSPMLDWGYDISDHTDVDPTFGTLADARQLIDETHRRGMRIIIDYVINHTSSDHPWFVDSRSSRDADKRDWYVWRDPAPDGGPPNNWVSVFSGPAWTLDEPTGQYYRHSYLPHQPDLNWRNPDVVRAMEDVARFWLDLGVDGFRVDGAHQMMKDPLDRDNPLVPEGYVDPYKDMGEYGKFDHLYDIGHEDVHGVHRKLRSVLDEYPDTTSVSEVHVFDLEGWARYYGAALDEFHMPFNFHLMVSDWDARSVRRTVESVLAVVPEGTSTNWTLGNHDEHRIMSRLGAHDARLAAMLLLTLPGSVFTYYGDEIGMRQGDIAPDDARDPWGRNVSYLSRDGCRTPMQWTPGPGAGFTTGAPWLPIAADSDVSNVESELADPDSMLNLYGGLLTLRRATPALTSFRFRVRPESDDRVFVFERGSVHAGTASDAVIVALNFSGDEIELPGIDGEVILSTSRHRSHPDAKGLVLAAHEGIVVRSDN